MKNLLSTDDYKKPGIYIITNSINTKMYIGSTISLFTRYKTHISHLTKDIHCNIHLQRFTNKYGIDTLSFSLLEIVENKNDLTCREQYYLDYYKSWDNTIGFNICSKADSCLGRVLSKASRAKLSKSLQGRSLSDTHITKLNLFKAGKLNPNFGGISKKTQDALIASRSKAIRVTDTINNKIYTFKSIADACRNLNFNSVSVSQACNNKYHNKNYPNMIKEHIFEFIV